METVIGRVVICHTRGTVRGLRLCHTDFPTGVFVVRVRRTVWLLSQPCLLSDTGMSHGWDVTRTLSSSHAVRCLVQGGVTVLGVSYLGVLDLQFLNLGHGDSRVGD